MFYTQFDNHDQTRIILSKVHDEMFWIGDAQVAIDNDLIHKVIGLSNEGHNPINYRNVRKLVETNLFTRFDGRNIKVDTIQDKGVKVLTKILGYKFNHGSRVNSVPTRFFRVASVMVVERRKVNLCEIIKLQLLDNNAKLKKTKNEVFRFESLLTHLFFYATKKFPGMRNWEINKCTMKLVTQCYREKLENVRDR